MTVWSAKEGRAWTIDYGPVSAKKLDPSVYEIVGPGPWSVFGASGSGVTDDADPRRLYNDVLVALVPERRINNGQPSGQPIDVLTRFLTPEGDASGRPVGVAMRAAEGNAAAPRPCSMRASPPPSAAPLPLRAGGSVACGDREAQQAGAVQPRPCVG